MCRGRVEGLAAVLACSLLLVACAANTPASARDVADANDTGGRVKSKTPADVIVLKELSRLPSGSPRRLGNATVVAETAYSAASGQTCRAVHVTTQPGHQPTNRLACNDGGQWFFVPDVFAGEPAE